MRAARQTRQHAGGFIIVCGLAQDVAVQRHRGVGAKHGRGRQAARLQALHGRLQLQPRHALHVAIGRLAGQHGFQRFGVFARFGQQQFVMHADLLQQLAAARTL